MSTWDTDKRVAFGLQKEKELLPTIEASVGCKLTKTADTYDLVDWEGPGVVVELKARRAYDAYGWPQHHKRFASWLFPTHKEKAFGRAEKAILFYYFAADDTLWRLDYDPAVFKDIEKEVPEWHRQYQEHWYIPSDLWKRVV